MEKLLLSSQNCADLAKPNIEIKRFPDGETYIRVLEEVEGKDVAVLHRCYPKQDSSLLQLMLIGGAVSGRAKSMTAMVPYLPYARQDKAWKEGEAKSADIVCGLIASSGFSQLVTFDCHFLKGGPEHSQRGLKILNKSMGKALLSHVTRGVEDPLIVSPDLGAGYLVEGKGYAMRKVRGEYSTSNKRAFREVEELTMDFPVRGRNIVILDDMIAGGGTMARAVRLCNENGAKSVRCAATHGLFLNFADQRILDAGAEEIVVTDTIPCQYTKVRIKEHLFTPPLMEFV